MQKVLFAILMLATSLVYGAPEYKPLSIPDNVRVTSSKPREVVWAGLTSKEKNLATHLLNAARYGRDIIFYQSHRQALTIKAMVENSLKGKNFAKTKAFLGEEGFKEYQNYVAKFEDQNGPYTSSNRKYVLAKVTAKQVTELFKKYLPATTPEDVFESVRLLTDPNFEVISQPEDPEGSTLEISGGNNYEKGLKGAEIALAIKNGTLKSDVNCRIVRGPQGTPACSVQALNNPWLDPVVRRALAGVVSEFKKALKYATTENQAAQIRYLISHLETGSVEDFRQMNIAWVKDGTSSKVDFMFGYVEVYLDYQNKIGSWESYVQIIDPKMTKLSVALAKHAQEFENAMPYGEFKKTFPANYSPPALMVYYFLEQSSFHSGGYNLPNYDDIRRDVGAKNIIRLDLPGQDVDPITLKVRREMYEEFVVKSRVDAVMNYWTKARQSKVLLHEIIGHGSGTYDTSKYGPKEDPVSALGSLGAALEEERADLTALTFSAHPRFVDVGFYANEAEGVEVRKAQYDAYLGNFMREISKQQTLSEAHMRGYWLLINILMEQGAVEKVSRDGSPMTDANFVLAVKDYDKFYKGAVGLLAELQRIKAQRDEAALKDLFEKHAPLSAINEPWMRAVIQRGKNLAINAGTIEQPWRIKSGKVEIFGKPSLEGIGPHYSK